jgi:hypothetical protein
MNVASPAPAIDWTNLDSEHALADAIFSELARETGDGVGITRECYSDREDAALGIFSAVAKAHGLLIDTDAAGNLVVRAPEDDGSRPAHYIGSHADSVPQGGNYDGAAGIVAGLICLIRLRETGRELTTPVRGHCSVSSTARTSPPARAVSAGRWPRRWKRRGSISNRSERAGRCSTSPGRRAIWNCISSRDR